MTNFFLINWTHLTIVIFGILEYLSLVEGKIKSQIKMLVASETLYAKHFKPGVSVEALPDAIFYNKYIPLVFQLKVPEWNTDSLRLNSSMHCISDNIKPNYFCPVAYHFERLLAPLADNLRFSKNIYAPTSSNDLGAGRRFFGQFSCEIIEPHFHHLSAAADDLHIYVDLMKKGCSLAKNLTVLKKNMTSTVSHHVSMANDRFETLMDTNKDWYNTEYKMVHMAAFSSFQTAFLLTKYIDTIRWSNAFTSCQSGKLNIGLINSYLLQSSLGPIKKTAEENGYKLSIPFHEFIPHYYKLALTDCILGIQSAKKTSLLIRVLVPVQKKESKYTRVRLTKIPYLVTEGGQKKICEIDSFDPRDDFLIEESPDSSTGTQQSVVTVSPDCYENELCHVTDQPRRIVVDPCLKGLMNESLEEIRDYCSFECFDIENEELVLPIIMKVSSNQYSITGSPPKNSKNQIAVYCDGKFNKVVQPNETNGVIQIQLSCNCDIRYKSEIYRPFAPCNAPLEFHYLTSVPIRIIYPTINSAEGPVPSAVDDISVKENNNKNRMEEIPDQQVPADWVVPLEVDAEEHTHHHDGCASHDGQLIFIWILIVILLATNGLLIYVAAYNRLIHFDLFGSLFSRWGFGSTSPRSRLQEDASQTNANGQWPATLNTHRL